MSEHERSQIPLIIGIVIGILFLIRALTTPIAASADSVKGVLLYEDNEDVAVSVVYPDGRTINGTGSASQEDE